METTQTTFDEALNNWLEAVRANILLKQQDPHYTTLAVESTPKYAKIVATHGRQQSIWAFVIKEDGHTQALGPVYRGDIHKAASTKGPAKHARGNIFQPGENGCCNITQWTGPNSLK